MFQSLIKPTICLFSAVSGYKIVTKLRKLKILGKFSEIFQKLSCFRDLRLLHNAINARSFTV